MIFCPRATRDGSRGVGDARSQRSSPRPGSTSAHCKLIAWPQMCAAMSLCGRPAAEKRDLLAAGGGVHAVAVEMPVWIISSGVWHLRVDRLAVDVEEVLGQHGAGLPLSMGLPEPLKMRPSMSSDAIGQRESISANCCPRRPAARPTCHEVVASRRIHSNLRHGSATRKHKHGERAPEMRMAVRRRRAQIGVRALKTEHTTAATTAAPSRRRAAETLAATARAPQWIRRTRQRRPSGRQGCACSGSARDPGREAPRGGQMPRGCRTVPQVGARRAARERQGCRTHIAELVLRARAQRGRL